MISKSRVEAFSDAIIAIIITIMALELPLPKQNNFEEIKNFILAIFIFLTVSLLSEISGINIVSCFAAQKE